MMKQRLPHGERRSGLDRRGRPSSPLNLNSRRRRKEARRKEDRQLHLYADLYGPGLFLIFIMTAMMCIVDAFITLRLVGAGFYELNPIMNWVLGFGPLQFLVAKYLMTVLGLGIVLIHKDHFLGQQVKTLYVLFMIPVLYSILMVYELTLM